MEKSFQGHDVLTVFQQIGAVAMRHRRRLHSLVSLGGLSGWSMSTILAAVLPHEGMLLPWLMSFPLFSSFILGRRATVCAGLAGMSA